MISEKKQKIFNIVSIVIICILGIYYLSRLIYFKILNDKNTSYSELLAEQVKERVSKYEVAPTLINDEGVYRFANNAKNNYIKFMGYTWRIVKVNSDNTITLVTEESIISLPYNDSQITNWLDEIFSKTLDTNYLVNTISCTDDFNNSDNYSCNKNDDSLISLLSVEDYVKAGSKNSYLNNKTHFWTTNTNKDQIWHISVSGDIATSNSDIVHEVRPVITLKSDTKVIDGNGTIDNPYIVLEHNPNKTNDLFVGEYLKLNDSIWRVVSKNEDKIKIVSEDYIKENDKIYETKYSNYDNLTNDEDSLIYYLNNTYYNNFKEKELIVEGTFYNGAIIDEFNYKNTYDESTNLMVGLLSIAEPFIYDFGNVFTFSRNENNNSGIYIINNDKKLFEDDINNLHYVRPSIYIKNNITIINGNGSYLNPYILGGELNEEENNNN